MIKINNFINGNHISPKTNKYMDDISPVTGEIFYQVASSSEREVDQAVDAAKSDFPAWSKMPVFERAVILNRLADFVPIPSVETWQLSNSPIFQLAVLRAFLNIFDMTDIKNFRQKSPKLTAYPESLLSHCSGSVFGIITPSKQGKRSCQLSLKFKNYALSFFYYLENNGISCDYRHQNVIRVALFPLYNTFSETYRLFQIIQKWLLQCEQ